MDAIATEEATRASVMGRTPESPQADKFMEDRLPSMQEADVASYREYTHH